LWGRLELEKKDTSLGRSDRSPPQIHPAAIRTHKHHPQILLLLS
jgi:hypothetical protein